MRIRIRGYDVPPAPRFELDLPRGAQFLSCEPESSALRAWFLIDPDASEERRRFALFGAEDNVPEEIAWKYLSTFVTKGSNENVVHLFEGG